MKLTTILLLLPTMAFGRIIGVPTVHEQMASASSVVSKFISDYSNMTNKIAKAQTSEYKASLAAYNPNECRVIPGATICVNDRFGCPMGNIGMNFGQNDGRFEVLPTISMADYKKRVRCEMTKLCKNTYVRNEFSRRHFHIR